MHAIPSSTNPPDGTGTSAANVASGLTSERVGTQCRITIRRIDKHNALSREVLAALADAVRAAGNDEAVGHVVVTGDGSRFFAAGGDLVDLAAVRSVDDTRAFAATSRAALDAIRTCPLPVVAWLNGDAIGGGAELALACDLRVMTPAARIGFVQSRLAITSAWGGGPDLVRVVGPSRAMRMMLRAEMLTCDEAMRDGAVDAVIDGGPDGDAAAGFFAPLASAPRHVLAAIKANVLACRAPEIDAAARAAEEDHLVATWTHDAHWAAVDRVFAKTRKGV